MLTAIKHGLRNLVNFNGRDARQTFWFFVLFIFIIEVAISLIVLIPLGVTAVSKIAQEASAAGHTDDPAMAEIQARAIVGHAVSGVVSGMVLLGVVVNLLMVAVLAAAFVRRLHDSNLSGFWALIPGVAQVTAAVLAPSQAQRMMQAMGDAFSSGSEAEMQAKIQALQTSGGAASAIGWVPILVVIVLGIRESTKGPNRYGEGPFIA